MSSFKLLLRVCCMTLVVVVVQDPPLCGRPPGYCCPPPRCSADRWATACHLAEVFDATCGYFRACARWWEALVVMSGTPWRRTLVIAPNVISSGDRFRWTSDCGGWQECVLGVSPSVQRVGGRLRITDQYTFSFALRTPVIFAVNFASFPCHTTSHNSQFI